MRLFIDGIAVTANPGERLLDIIQRLQLETGQLSDRPLAAQIAGEVFTLNYIPQREVDVSKEREAGKSHDLRLSGYSQNDMQ